MGSSDTIYRKLRRVCAAAGRFVRENAVFAVAAAAALVCMPLAPAGTDYPAFIDVKTIACLFCILAVVGMLTNAGLFMAVSQMFRRAFPTLRRTVCALVGATMVLSMFLTNDMALIIMLPLAANILVYAGWHRALAFCFIMQNLAANLGGMIMPFGNPQNLFLFGYYGIGLEEFIRVMTLPFIASAMLIFACCIVIVRFYSGNRGSGESSESPKDATRATVGKSVKGSTDTESSASPMGTASPTSPRNSSSTYQRQVGGSGLQAPKGLVRPIQLAIGALLFVLTVLAVFRVVHFAVALVIVVVALLIFDRKALVSVDWLLLATFVCFFLFSGAVSQIPAIKELLAGWMRQAPLLTSAGVSQVISNVPAAALLSQVTDVWQPLLVGVNIGGAGTPIASLASLITIERYGKLRVIERARETCRFCPPGRFVALLVLYGFAFLGALFAICSLAA